MVLSMMISLGKPVWILLTVYKHVMLNVKLTGSWRVAILHSTTSERGAEWKEGWKNLSCFLLILYTCTNLYCSPKSWIPEQKVLGKNFSFWLMALGLADKAFKNIRTVGE